MKVQLLLLSALVGLLCAFTSANPITDPTELYSSAVAITEGEATAGVTLVNNPVVTSLPPSEPTTVHVEITTHVFNDHTTVPALTTEARAQVTETEAPNTPTQYTEYTSEETPSSTEQVFSEPQTDDLAETMGPTGTVIPADTEGTAERVGPVGTETTGLIIEEDTEGEESVGERREALSSGQIVGIVVGALLAVAVITAVVIVVLKRMGEYSP
ncbi:podoplanin isoform X1 [Pelmatolapia mariae]|uniref:podoplanin isoform X1 n=1 Tax=Pelmatolapia mariae TaxID=158779 RepID=UPI002FE534AD